MARPKKQLDLQTLPQPQNTVYYTTDELCNLLHINKQTLFNRIHSGIFKAVKYGGIWHILPPEPNKDQIYILKTLANYHGAELKI